MTRDRAEALLCGEQAGIQEWNVARANGEHIPTLHQLNLISRNLCGANLSKLNLCEADFRGANLIDADLHGANLTRARLSSSNLTRSNLSFADLGRADLGGANLTDVKFIHTAFGYTLVAADLSSAIGLENTIHYGPSNITLNTLLSFRDELPERFLRGCGVPHFFLKHLRSIIAEQGTDFYSCFISYSSQDEAFVHYLHERMMREHLQVWFAPQKVKAGQKLFEQIRQAIRQHDKLLLVLSDASIVSEWVMTEIRSARERETKEKRRVLFPIRLTNIDKLKQWAFFDADTGKDLAVEAREYFIPDFSNWKDHDSFERSFERLLKDLRKSEENDM